MARGVLIKTKQVLLFCALFISRYSLALEPLDEAELGSQSVSDNFSYLRSIDYDPVRGADSERGLEKIDYLISPKSAGTAQESNEIDFDPFAHTLDSKGDDEADLKIHFTFSDAWRSGGGFEKRDETLPRNVILSE